MLRRQAPLPLRRRQALATAAIATAVRKLTPIHRGALYSQRRCLHERPYLELPPDTSKGEAYEAARDALLQLNIMTRRGIEPDALMYTALIHTMGRAGLEWQAYKLFSRMVEAKVRPLPETYVALRDATSRHRTRLREDIQAKIEEAVATFPDELAEAERSRQRDEDRACIARFEEYMRGELPPPAATTPTARQQQQQQPSSSLSGQAEMSHGAVDHSYNGSGASADTHPSGGTPAQVGAPVPTMHIRNPTDAWSTARYAEELRGQPSHLASDAAADNLQTTLNALHEEELRIFLAANRQLRHGDKAQLVRRVLETVGEASIRAMLDRRRHYFRSVESILAADLAEVKNGEATETANRRTSHRAEMDRTMAKEEKASTAPEVLLTPWGLLRKPLRHRPDRTMAAHRSHQQPPQPQESKIADDHHDDEADRRIGRLEKVRLMAPELLLIRRKSESDELDELPESLLRRYAFQFRLRWRRRKPNSLLRAVQWHATTFLAAQVREGVVNETEDGADALLQRPPPTPGIRLKREKEGMAETLENFEAFRIISQRTNNLQVVDDKETNLHLKRIHRDALRRERRTDEALRREEHLLATASLATAARTYTPEPETAEMSTGHVLGWEASGRTAARLQEGGKTDTVEDVDAVGVGTHLRKGAASTAMPSSSSSTGAPTPSATVDELPPWALTGGEEGFNLSTGRFGDPSIGRFQELSDSTIRVLPSREAQKQWTVDRHLLPRDLKDVVERTELEQLRYGNAVESEYGRRRQYARYRRWDNMIQRSRGRKQLEREAMEGAGEGGEKGGDREAAARPMRPLPAKKRLAQLLRHGVERQKVSEAAREKYNRGL